MSEPLRWPYDQPHIAYTRWGVRMPSGLLLKGLSRGDAYELHDEGTPVAIIMRQTVVYVTSGPDEGYEVLGPWKSVPAEKRDEQDG